MMNLKGAIASFLDEIATGRVEVYNEFSLQHELGIYLRSSLPEHRIQFERNVSHYQLTKGAFLKREIDISIMPKRENKLLHAIELKFPDNGQYPEQMFSFCKDIGFAEQLARAGVGTSYVLILVQDKGYYSGRESSGIYAFYRNGKPVHGEVIKPTGKKDARFNIHGSYPVQWVPVGSTMKYALIEVARQVPQLN
jgi:hypothetical protein